MQIRELESYERKMCASLLTCLVQFSSVAQLCPNLWDPIDCSIPGFPILYQLVELAQTHVHPVGNVNKPSHPLSSLSPPAFNISQHQGLLQWVSSSHQVAKVLELQLQHQHLPMVAQLLKESACNVGDLGSIHELGRSPGEGNEENTPVFWPGEFHGLYSPWGRKESDTTKPLSRLSSFLSYLDGLLQHPFWLFCISSSWAWFWSLPHVQCYKPLSIVLQAHCLPRLIPWIYLSLPLYWAFLVTQSVKNLPVMLDTWNGSLGWDDPLEEGMATHSSVLPRESLWTEKPGGL